MDRARHQPGEQRAQQGADDAADAGERGRLHEELLEHVAARSPDGHAHADLACSLRDGDEHDVHHADAAHDQCDQGNYPEHHDQGVDEGVGKFRPVILV